MGFDEFSDIILSKVVSIPGFEYEIEGKLILNFKSDHKIINLRNNIIISSIKNNSFGLNLLILNLPIPGSIPKILGEYFASLYKITS